MTDPIPQLRQWLEARRDKAAEKMREQRTDRGAIGAVLTARYSAEHFFAMDALDKLKELEAGK